MEGVVKTFLPWMLCQHVSTKPEVLDMNIYEYVCVCIYILIYIYIELKSSLMSHAASQVAGPQSSVAGAGMIRGREHLGTST